MRAAFLTGLRRVEVREAPDPKIEGSCDVLLRVEAVGVCGSDMHYFRTGRIGEQVVQFPWTVGHECAATVVEVGSDVTNVRAGDRVVVDPLLPCGQCDQCTGGRVHTCRNQRFLGNPAQKSGALAELLVMPAGSCFPIPDEVTPERGVLLEPFSIGLYCRRLAGDVAGKAAGVLGSGPIGLCVIKALRAARVGKVYATDIRENRADLAGACGADWSGSPRAGDIVAQIGKLEPTGLDLVYEAAGEQETIDQGLELLRPGGTLLIVGIPEFDRGSFFMDTMRRKELVIRNVRRQNECVGPAIRMVADGEVTLDDLVTHHFPLDETQDAFDVVSDYRDGVVKAIIHL